MAKISRPQTKTEPAQPEIDDSDERAVLEIVASARQNEPLVHTFQSKPTGDVREQLSGIVDSARYGGTCTIILKHGAPAAAIVPIQLVDRYVSAEGFEIRPIKATRPSKPQPLMDQLRNTPTLKR